jgi:hypothetical protein
MTSKLKVNIIADGGDNAIMTSNGSGTLTLNNAALKNTPAFHATMSASQTLSNNTFTKLQVNTEIYDTDGCYDNSSNYRFTPTVAGKYLVYGCSQTGGSNNVLQFSGTALYKNGSQQTEHFTDFRDTRGGSSNFTYTSIVMDMNGSSDYAELYGRMNVDSGNVNIQGGLNITYFGAYRIVGA